MRLLGSRTAGTGERSDREVGGPVSDEEPQGGEHFGEAPIGES